MGGRAPARQRSIRRHNLALLLTEIERSGPISRAELARRIGLTKATVSSMVEALRGAGLLEEKVPPLSGVARGRPGSPVGFSVQAPVAIGIEIAVDYVSACLVDLDGTVRRSVRHAQDHRRGDPAQHLARAVECARGLLANAPNRLVGLGVAIPGVIGDRGRVRAAPNLPAFVGHELAVELNELVTDLVTSAPGALCIEVGNEANLAALGELWYGGHDDLRDFVLVSGEIGVGAGVVAGGRLFAGAGGAAGELGHVTVDPSGPPCACGSSGCLERYVGQDVLLSRLGLDRREQLADALCSGEPAVGKVLEEAAHALGVATAALLNVVDVPAVVLGGLYAELAPALEAVLRAELERRVVAHVWRPTEVVVTNLGATAAMRGAAGVVLQRFFADPVAFIPALLPAE
ncbi:MAG: ROK family transcriptional regulator [Actinomycetota bacterium]|nr:ROK family transcriptional regulator [Actinomycetota bacterium]